VDGVSPRKRWRQVLKLNVPSQYRCADCVSRHKFRAVGLYILKIRIARIAVLERWFRDYSSVNKCSVNNCWQTSDRIPKQMSLCESKILFNSTLVCGCYYTMFSVLTFYGNSFQAYILICCSVFFSLLYLCCLPLNFCFYCTFLQLYAFITRRKLINLLTHLFKILTASYRPA